MNQPEQPEKTRYRDALGRPIDPPAAGVPVSEPVPTPEPVATPEPPKDVAADSFDEIAESFAEFTNTAATVLLEPVKQLTEPAKKVIRSWVSLVDGVREKVEGSAKKKGK